MVFTGLLQMLSLSTNFAKPKVDMAALLRRQNSRLSLSLWMTLSTMSLVFLLTLGLLQWPSCLGDLQVLAD